LVLQLHKFLIELFEILFYPEMIYLEEDIGLLNMQLLPKERYGV